MASKTATQASKAGAGLVEQAKGAASAAGQMADKATSGVGSGMESLGQTLHQNAPSGGMIGAAAHKTADALESSGRYLRQEGISGVGEDVTECIRNNPLAAFLTAVAGGFLLAQLTRE